MFHRFFRLLFYLQSSNYFLILFVFTQKYFMRIIALTKVNPVLAKQSTRNTSVLNHLPIQIYSLYLPFPGWLLTGPYSFKNGQTYFKHYEIKG